MGYNRTSKYTAEFNGRLKVDILDTLAKSMNSMTISDLQSGCIGLSSVTSQKLARVLNELVEMGLVQKGQSRSTKRMKYMATSVMHELGYEVIEDS